MTTANGYFTGRRSAWRIVPASTEGWGNTREKFPVTRFAFAMTYRHTPMHCYETAYIEN
jgi:hypothetical protein